MKLRKISLDGQWQIIGQDPTSGQTLQLQGQVPGQVHVDLIEAGKIPDPFWRDQSDQCQWVEKWDWIYTRQFELTQEFDPSWAVLEFEGLDTYATILLNGQEIGKTRNMFIPHRFEVGSLLRPGTNTIEVRLIAQIRALGPKQFDRYFSCFSEDRVFTRKMQCGYGWDWVTRLVSAGVWRPVNLFFYEKARIDDVFVWTEKLEGGDAQLRIEFAAERRTEEPLTVQFAIRDPEGHTAWSRSTALEGSTLKLTALLKNPRLWWPVDYGEQPLYTCHVMLCRADGSPLESRAVEFGVRTVFLEEIPDEVGSSFTLCINGQRIFGKGGNWVPADPFPSRITPEKYQRLLGLARDAHINLLRSWGGGIYEPEAFWQACNRMGIMITQDFLLSCASYPEDDPDFMDQLRDEFPKVIRMLRNHPSLVLWAGDNECGMFASPDDDYPGKIICHTISGPICTSMDPSRPYRYSSPYGGSPKNCITHGDCHESAWYVEDLFQGDMSDYQQRIARLGGRFLSETNAPGVPPKHSLLKFMTEEDLTDPKAEMWEFHTKDNPYKGMGDLTHYKMTVMQANNIYGETKDLGLHLAHLEYGQHEWMRLTIENTRRKKFFCSGIQYWMYNDCWPASGWSVVDYYGYAKAGYYSQRRTYAPVITSMIDEDGALQVWVCNDRLEPISGEISLRVQPWEGAPSWTHRLSFEAPANTSLMVHAIPLAELEGKLHAQSIMVCDMKTAKETDRSWFYRGVPKQMELPQARLQVSQEGNGQSGTVTIRTDNFARVVTLAADLDFSDNYFDLLPGEERTIRWSAPEGSFNGSIPVTCWNGVKVDD